MQPSPIALTPRLSFDQPTSLHWSVHPHTAHQQRQGQALPFFLKQPPNNGPMLNISDWVFRSHKGIQISYLYPPHYSAHLSPPLMRGSLYSHACQHCISNTRQRGLPHICMMNRLTTVYLAHTSYTSPSSNEGYPGLAGYTVTNTISGDCTAHPSQPTYSTSAGPGHIMQNIHTSDHQSPSQRLSFFSFFF